MADDGLREALIDYFWELRGLTGDQSREEADALLSGPLAPLLIRLAAAETKVQRVEMLRESARGGSGEVWDDELDQALRGD